MVAKVKTNSVLDFPDAQLPDLVAVKALWTGEATPEQQIRAIEWITKNVCMIGGMSFTLAEGPRATDFTEGKRYVGGILIYCAKTTTKELSKRYPDQLRHGRGEEHGGAG